MQTKFLPMAAVILCGLDGATLAQSAFNGPDQLPAYHGQVELFTLTPRGDIDGLVLTDGTEVKTPPHLSTEIALLVRPGDAVTIHGLKAAKLPLIQALSVTNDRDRRTVVDRGAAPSMADPREIDAGTRAISGQVRMALHGPRGEQNGVLLDDGTILKLPPSDLDRFADLLGTGHHISVEVRTHVTVSGTVVDVTALGPSPQKLEPVD